MEDTQYSKESFYLLGAGGYAREIESWYHNTLFSDKYKLDGYIDDNLNVLEGIENDYRILDCFNDGTLWKESNIVVAIASCEVKEKLEKQLSLNKCNVLSFKHDSTLIGRNSKFGKGYVFCPYVIISCNVIIGDLVTINSGSQIGHDVIIGNYTSIMANVDVGGGAVIGNNVFIGSNAVILPGVKIPDYTRIGAGSVVIRTIKKVGTYFGNPAKKIF